MKSWYLPDTADYRQRFGLQERQLVGKQALLKIAEENRPAFERWSRN